MAMTIRKTSVVMLLALLGCGLLPPSAMASGMAERIVRERVAGIDVLVYPTAVKDVVTVAGAFPAGDAHAGEGNLAAPTLAGMMLDRGTMHRDKLAVATQLEEVAASIGFGVDTQATTVNARLLKEDLPRVVGLIAEQLREPAFDPAEFELARQQFIGSLQMAQHDVGARASEAFTRSVYPEEHPNHPASIEEFIDAARALTLADVKAFHASHYGPAHFTLVFVGDVDAAAVKAEVARAFAGWERGVAYRQPEAPAVATRASVQQVQVPGKTSVSVLLGQATGLRASDPEATALALGTSVLGSGFTGRLMASVRDREGLTYGIDAGASSDRFTDGHWAINATFAPELLDQGIVSTRRELDRWWREGITAEELAARKQQRAGTWRIGLSTTRGIAGAILGTVLAGRELSWLDEYPRVVDALTLEQVNGAIRKYLNPAKMLLVESGTLPEQRASSSPAAVQGAK